MIGAMGMEHGGYAFRAGAVPTAAEAAPRADRQPMPDRAGDPTPTTIPAEGRKQNGDTPRELWEKYRCRTCETRTYQDGSNDPGVSMKTPTKISPQNAAAAVMGHEQQHVSRNAIKAELEGRRVISSTVSIHNAICPECGVSFVAGGTTRTVTASKQDAVQQTQQKRLDTHA